VTAVLTEVLEPLKAVCCCHMKSRRVSWAENLERMGKRRCAYGFWWGSRGNQSTFQTYA